MIRVKPNTMHLCIGLRFENLVNYDKSKTVVPRTYKDEEFENLVNYDKSKTY